MSPLAVFLYALVVLVTALVTFLAYSFVRYLAEKRKYRALPGPPPVFLLGNLHQIVRAGMVSTFIAQNAKKYGKMFTFWIGMRPVVALLDPNDGTKVFNLTCRGPLLASWVEEFGGGKTLFFMEGDKWKHRRKLIQPTFGSKQIRSLLKPMTECIDVFVQRMNGIVLGGQMSTRTSIDILPEIKRLTLDVIGYTSFGYKFNNCLNGNDPVSASFTYTMDVLEARMVHPFPGIFRYIPWWPSERKSRKAIDVVYSTIDHIISQRVARPSEEHHDFLSLLLSAEAEPDQADAGATRMTKTQIRQELHNFLFAGYETTTITVCCLLYQLAQHPEHQARVQQEVDQLWEEIKDAEITMDHLNKLVHLEMCIKESQRMMPIAHWLGRFSYEPLTINGVTLPENTMYALGVYEYQHDPKLWDCPMEFRPERFARKEDLESKPKLAYMPFGAGAKSCVGMQFAWAEMKVVLLYLLHLYEFVCDPQAPPLKFREKLSIGPEEVHLIVKRRR